PKERLDHWCSTSACEWKIVEVQKKGPLNSTSRTPTACSFSFRILRTAEERVSWGTYVFPELNGNRSGRSHGHERQMPYHIRSAGADSSRHPGAGSGRACIDHRKCNRQNWRRSRGGGSHGYS